MATKTVKISEENYKWLCEVAGGIQSKEKRVASLDEALTLVHAKTKGKLSDLAGSWNMTDAEVAEFTKDLKKGWSRWTKSA